MPPNNAPTSRAGKAGTFFTIITITNTGTINKNGLRLKRESMAVKTAELSVGAPDVSKVKPHTKNIISVIASVGNVVYII